MTAVPRLQLLPAPGATPGGRSVAAPDRGEQQVKPVLPTRLVQRDLQHYPHADETSRPDRPGPAVERRVADRRLSDRQDGQAGIDSNRRQHGSADETRTASRPTAAAGKLLSFSRLSSMPFMVQLLGQEGADSAGLTKPQTSLSEHRDAALLGSDVYRKAGGEPGVFPEGATLVRLAV